MRSRAGLHGMALALLLLAVFALLSVSVPISVSAQAPPPPPTPPSPSPSPSSSPTFNVLDFGADPTASRDSGPAVGKASLAMQQSLTGGVLYFPPGRYLMIEPLFPGQAFVNISSETSPQGGDWVAVGAGADQTLLFFNSEAVDAPLFAVTGGGAKKTWGMGAMAVYSLPLSSPPRAQQPVLLLAGVHGSNVFDVSVASNGSLVPFAAFGSSALLFRNIYIGGSFAAAILLDDCEDVVVQNCAILGDAEQAHKGQVGVRVTGSAQRVRILNSMFSNITTGVQSDSGPLLSAVEASGTDPSSSWKSLSLLRSAFANVSTGVAVLDAADVHVTACFFNTTAAQFQPATGVALVNADGAAGVGRVIVAQSYFVHQAVGVGLYGGLSSDVSDNEFLECAMGVFYEPPPSSSSVADDEQQAPPPLVLIGNYFNGTRSTTVTIRGGTMWVVTDNVCVESYPGADMQLQCKANCVLENNRGC